MLFFKMFLKLEVHGTENIPSKGGFILASNHSSYLDPIVLGVVSFRRLDFMAKDTLFKNPVSGWVLRRVGAFPVKRNYHDIGAIKESIRRLNVGRAMVMFPEGRRSDENNIMEPRPGVAFVAYKAGVPVIPAFITGTDKALPKGSKIIRQTKIEVCFGKKIFIERRQAYDQVAREIMQHVGRLECK